MGDNGKTRLHHGPWIVLFAAVACSQGGQANISVSGSSSGSAFAASGSGQTVISGSSGNDTSATGGNSGVSSGVAPAPGTGSGSSSTTGAGFTSGTIGSSGALGVGPDDSSVAEAGLATDGAMPLPNTTAAASGWARGYVTIGAGSTDIGGASDRASA